MSETFNYYTMPKDSFEAWATLVLVSSDTKDMAKYNALSEATDGFTNVNLTMQMNGVEVDAMHLLKRMHDGIEEKVKREAARIVSENSQWIEIEDIVSDTMKAAREAVYKQLRAVGIEMTDYED